MIPGTFVILSLALTSGAPAPPPIDIQRLIRQLAAGKPADRETAARMLAAIGEPALPYLRIASQADRDPEIRKRSTALRDAIDRTLFNETRMISIHRGWATRLIVGRDGKQVLSNGLDGPRIWSLSAAETFRLMDRPAAGTVYSALALSANGLKAAGGSGPNVVIWDVETGKVVQTLNGHTKPISCVAISQDGSWAASGSYDGSIRFWDVSNGKELVSFNDLGAVRYMVLSPDGALLAASTCTNQQIDPGIIHVWDVKNRKLVQTFHGHDRMVACLAFSPDGKRLASASWDRTVRMWRLSGDQQREPLVGHTGNVVAVAFSSDGSRLVSCGDETDASLRVWETESEKHRFTGSIAVGMNALAALPDGKSVLVGCKDGSIRVWRWTH